MESEEILRLEICEKCYQHQQIDMHSENSYIQAYQELSKVCGNLNIKIKRNANPKYLKKISSTKISTRRFVDVNTGKVVEFPRKGAFQIYCFNVLIFSKLEYGHFPSFDLLSNILTEIQRIHNEDPMLKGLQRFRHIEFEYQKNSVQSIYSHLKMYCDDDDYTLQELRNGIKRLRSAPMGIMKKIIYPYSFYENKEKKSKMQSIYCPRGFEPHENTSTKYSKIKGKIFKITNQNIYDQQNSITKQQSTNKSDVFSSIGIKNRKIKPKFNFVEKNKDQMKIKEQSKNLYTSFLIYPKNKSEKKFNKSSFQKSKDQNSIIERVSLPKNQDKNLRPFTGTTRKCYQVPSERVITTRKTYNANKQYISHNQKEIKDTVGQIVDQIIHRCEKQNQSVEKHENEGNKISKKKLHKKSKQNQINNKTQQIFRENIQKEEEQQSKQIMCKSFISKHSQKQNKSPFKEESRKHESAKSEQFFLKKSNASNVSEPEESKSPNNANKQSIRQSNNNEQSFRKQQEKKNDLEKRKILEKAEIRKNFSQAKSYFSENLNFQTKQQHIQQQTNFLITGIEITKKINIYSLREAYSLDELTFFPSSLTKVINSSSKLASIVNFLISLNPKIISRIFQHKNSLSEEGMYCIWLMNLKGIYEPIYVNDQFAFDEARNFIYADLEKQNSIWFMILEKCVAKMLGGYQMLNDVSFSTLLKTILACPTVDFHQITPRKALKIFEKSTFSNRMAKIYAYDITHQKQNQVVEVVGFKQNYVDLNQSYVRIKYDHTFEEITLSEFLESYSEISLIFFDMNYFMNQSTLTITSNKTYLLSCRFHSVKNNNNAYLMFHHFPINHKTKVTVYQLLKGEVKLSNEGYSSFDDDKKKYKYLGQITKSGTFFFQLQLATGQYLCLMENSYKFEPASQFSIFSSHPVHFSKENIGKLEEEKEEIPESRIKVNNNEIIERQKEKVIFQKKIVVNHSKAKQSQISKISKCSMQMQKHFLIKDDDDSDKENGTQIQF